MIPLYIIYDCGRQQVYIYIYIYIYIYTFNRISRKNAFTSRDMYPSIGMYKDMVSQTGSATTFAWQNAPFPYTTHCLIIPIAGLLTRVRPACCCYGNRALGKWSSPTRVVRTRSCVQSFAYVNTDRTVASRKLRTHTKCIPVICPDWVGQSRFSLYYDLPILKTIQILPRILADVPIRSTYTS